MPYVPLATSYDHYTNDCWTYDGRLDPLQTSKPHSYPSLLLSSSLSLLINIITPHSLSSTVMIKASFESYSNTDPFMFPGFAGRLARFQSAKHTLDLQVWEWSCVFNITVHLQWSSDIVFQEDYFSLLNATEIGQRITYSPSSYSNLLPSFTNYVTMAIDQV